MFGGGAGGGKSWLGCEWLLTNCYFYPGSKWFIGRAELKRLMASSYVTWTKVCKHHSIPLSDWKLNGQYNFIEFTNGSRIDLLDLAYKPSDPMYERLGSLEYTGGWVEEAGEVNFMGVDVLRSRVGRHMNKDLGLAPKTLFTCNPNKEWLYREVYKPFKEGQLKNEWAFIQSLYNDNPHTAADYKLSLSDIVDKATKERLMFGNWEYDDDPNQLMEYDAIIDLFTNFVPASDQRYLVADIARYGSDRTVITVWKGMQLEFIKMAEKQGIDETTEDIKGLEQLYKIPRSHILIDEDGVGGGVKDHLRGCKGFVNNSTPLEYKGVKQNYQNLKTQCSYILAEKVNNREISVLTTDERVKESLIEELEQIKSKDLDKDGKLKIKNKDEVKEALGRSPDIADCLMMRMYFELRPAVKRKAFTPSFNYARR